MRPNILPGILFMSLLLAIFLLMGIDISPKGAAPIQPQRNPPGTGANWILAFDDEFGGKSLDESNWYPTCPWSGKNYLCSAGDGSLNCFDPRNVFVQQGVLVLRAERRTLACAGSVKHYDGAWVATDNWLGRPHFSFTYGYLEARIKMPSSSGGQGYWAGFWSGAIDGGWPPELDVVEWQSNYPTIVGLYYHRRCSGGNCRAGGNVNLHTNLSDGWHTYGVDLEPDGVTWYIDHRRVYAWVGKMTAVPMDIRLSYEVNGAQWDQVLPSTSFPQAMRIAYVRFWRHSSTSEHLH